MRKFGWSESRKFWEERSARWAQSAPDDPEALQNVICAGEPEWLNRSLARYQKATYRALLDFLPRPVSGERALDVGCGAGRWSRFLFDRGYRVVGIDIQPELIEATRRRYPEIEFVCTSVQEYSHEEPFDLVSSVTVIQHNPYEEQCAVIERLRRMLKSGGHFVMLEGIKETDSPELFPRPVEEWIEIFEERGFRSVAIQRYNYNLFLTSFLKAGRWLKSLGGARRFDEARKPLGEPLPEEKTDLRRNAVKRLAVWLDAPSEPLLARTNATLCASNCGFLLQAV